MTNIKQVGEAGEPGRGASKRVGRPVYCMLYLPIFVQLIVAVLVTNRRSHSHKLCIVAATHRAASPTQQRHDMCLAHAKTKPAQQRTCTKLLHQLFVFNGHKLNLNVQMI